MKRSGTSPMSKGISSPNFMVLTYHSPLKETKGLLREITNTRFKRGDMPGESGTSYIAESKEATVKD